MQVNARSAAMIGVVALALGGLGQLAAAQTTAPDTTTPVKAPVAAPVTAPATAPDTTAMKVPAAMPVAAPTAAAPTPPDPGPPLREATQTIPLERVVAVVGDQPVLWSSVLEAVNVRRAQGMQIPPDSAGQLKVIYDVTSDLIDQELLVQKGRDLKVDISDDDVAPQVDQQVKRVRAQFASDVEYRSELKKAGFGSPEEWRKGLIEQEKRNALQQKVIQKLKDDGKLLPASVSEEDVDKAFEANRDKLPKRPAQVTFRQIVVAPKPSPAAKTAAKAKADTILNDLKHGADFAEIAKRESMDPSTREVGGDLGWTRRGIMVREFDAWMFALPPGQLSPVIETVFGYHIIKVDRVKPGEVKASQILIRWSIDSGAEALAHLRADSVLALWQGGMSFDTLVVRFHDSNEEKGSLQPFPRDSLPPSYQKAFAAKNDKDFVPPFPIPDRTNNSMKFVVAQILSSTEGGEYTVADLRQQIRDELRQERSIRHLLDSLRKDKYVSVRIDIPPAGGAATASVP
jgi:peptidyl-prolyl cis-trans isomerase SurA